MSKKSPNSSKTIFDRLKNARSALLANPKFQTFCAAFWPTRPITRSRAAAVFDLCNGFVYSQILTACVTSDLLAALRDKNMTLEEIAAQCELPNDGAKRLVLGAVALEILEPRSNDRYGLGAVGAAVLGNPGLQGMIAHHDLFYRDLADPLALLKERTKTTALASYWRYSPAKDGDAEERAAMQRYSDLMRDTQYVVADEVLRAYKFQDHACLMDVGGGDGTFLKCASEKAPDLKLKLFELPNVVDIARTRLTEARVKAESHAGNMFEDDWPEGADLITLIRVALDHDDGAVENLLARARKALKPGGVLLLAEPMADSRKVGHAYFGLYLWAMGSGRGRTSDELSEMLRRAGFTEIRVLSTGVPDLVRVIQAA